MGYDSTVENSLCEGAHNKGSGQDMSPYKKISVLIFLFVLLISLSGQAQTTTNPLMVKASIAQAGNKMQVNYQIRNAGADKAGHLAVTTFLARKTNRSESLGDISGGELTRYRCDFDTADLLPGHYIVATRIDFGDQNSQPHRVYHFSPITVKGDGIKNDPAALSIRLESPYFNRKSFWNPRGKFELTLKNNLPQPLEPVLTFFLPDGLTVTEPEKIYPLAAREEQTGKIPLTLDRAVDADCPYWIVAWYEVNGIHYAQLTTGIIRVAEAPVYFKLFLSICIVIILAVGVIYIYWRRKKSLSGT
jgi:hypothetical protein